MYYINVFSFIKVKKISMIWLQYHDKHDRIKSHSSLSKPALQPLVFTSNTDLHHMSQAVHCFPESWELPRVHRENYTWRTQKSKTKTALQSLVRRGTTFPLHWWFLPVLHRLVPWGSSERNGGARLWKTLNWLWISCTLSNCEVWESYFCTFSVYGSLYGGANKMDELLAWLRYNREFCKFWKVAWVYSWLCHGSG